MSRFEVQELFEKLRSCAVNVKPARGSQDYIECEFRGVKTTVRIGSFNGVMAEVLRAARQAGRI